MLSFHSLLARLWPSRQCEPGAGKELRKELFSFSTIRTIKELRRHPNAMISSWQIKSFRADAVTALYNRCIHEKASCSRHGGMRVDRRAGRDETGDCAVGTTGTERDHR